MGPAFSMPSNIGWIEEFRDPWLRDMGAHLGGKGQGSRPKCAPLAGGTAKAMSSEMVDNQPVAGIAGLDPRST